MLSVTNKLLTILQLKVYEQALKRNPRDTFLAAKMGQSLQKAHQYGKAINFYREAVKDEDNAALRYKLAELQMKLRQYEKAERTVAQAMEVLSDGPNDFESVMTQAKYYGPLAKVHKRNNNPEAAITVLEQVKDMRVRILKRVQVEQPEQRQLTAQICHLLAEHAVMQRILVTPSRT